MFRSMLIIWTTLACLFLFGVGLYALLAPGDQTGLAITLILLAGVLSYIAVVTGMEEWGWRRRTSAAAAPSGRRPQGSRRPGASRGGRPRGRAAVDVAAG